MYDNAVLDTDLSIHIHWDEVSGHPFKSPLGLQLAQAFSRDGLINHSVWVESLVKEGIAS
jgi:hypothetical protein